MKDNFLIEHKVLQAWTLLMHFEDKSSETTQTKCKCVSVIFLIKLCIYALFN